MNCDKVQEQIPNYLEDLLSETQRKDLRAHFADCERCTDYTLKQTSFASDLRRLTVLTPTFDLEKTVLEAFIASRVKQERRWPVVAALLALAIILFFCILIWRRGREMPPSAPVASTTATPKEYLNQLENIESILTEVSAAFEPEESPKPPLETQK